MGDSTERSNTGRGVRRATVSALGRTSAEAGAGHGDLLHKRAGQEANLRAASRSILLQKRVTSRRALFCHTRPLR